MKTSYKIKKIDGEPPALYFAIYDEKDAVIFNTLLPTKKDIDRPYMIDEEGKVYRGKEWYEGHNRLMKVYGFPEYVYSLEAETVLADAMMVLFREFFEKHTLPIAELEALVKNFSSAWDLSCIREFLELIHDYSYQNLMDKITAKPFWKMVYNCISSCYKERNMGDLLTIIAIANDQIKEPCMASRGDSKSAIAEEN